MKVSIDFREQTKHVLVCIRRGPKDKIIYNSGLVYFESEQMATSFTKEIRGKNPELEIKAVSVREAFPPPEGVPRKGYWCPYCRSQENWLPDLGGYKRCPICGVSHAEYHVKMYNQLWGETKPKKEENKKKK